MKSFLAELKKEYSSDDYDLFLDNMVEIRSSFRKHDLAAFTEKLNFIKAMLTRDNPNLRLAFDQFFPMTNPIVARSILEQRISEESRLQYEQWFEYSMNYAESKRALEQELEWLQQRIESVDGHGTEISDVSVQCVYEVAMMQRLALQQQRLDAAASGSAAAVPSALPTPTHSSTLPTSSQIVSMQSSKHARPVRVGVSMNSSSEVIPGDSNTSTTHSQSRSVDALKRTFSSAEIQTLTRVDESAVVKKARSRSKESPPVEQQRVSPMPEQVVGGVFSSISGLPRASVLSASLIPSDSSLDPLPPLPLPRHPKVSLAKLLATLPPDSLNALSSVSPSQSMSDTIGSFGAPEEEVEYKREKSKYGKGGDETSHETNAMASATTAITRPTKNMTGKDSLVVHSSAAAATSASAATSKSYSAATVSALLSSMPALAKRTVSGLAAQAKMTASNLVSSTPIPPYLTTQSHGVDISIPCNASSMVTHAVADNTKTVSREGSTHIRTELVATAVDFLATTAEDEAQT